MIGSPIVLKEVPHRIESTRANLMEEESSKIKGRRGIIINNSLTDRERIVKHFHKIKRIITLGSKKAKQIFK